MTYQPTLKASWAIRAAKLLSPDCTVVMIRFHHSDDWQSVELVHDVEVPTRDLLEDAQMALVKVLTQVK